MPPRETRDTPEALAEMSKTPLSNQRAGARDAALAGQRQGAGRYRGRASVGVLAREGERARAGLGQGARARDHAREGDRIGAVDREGAVVDDVADDRAGGAAIADLQRSGRNRGAARVSVGGCQNERAGAGLGEFRRSR